MYEESTAIPMIIAGPDVPAGHSVDTAVSLVDCYQTILEGAGLELTGEEHNDMPGHSLYDIANGARPERTVLSEYHAAGSITGMYMIRVEQWKYVHYAGYSPQLFDLASDPHETRDLAQSSEHREILQRCEAKLREIVDPEAASALAFQDQDAKIAAYGGVEAIRRRGDFGYTPAPGQTPVFD
jgi:choline-sulfatase